MRQSFPLVLFKIICPVFPRMHGDSAQREPAKQQTKSYANVSEQGSVHLCLSEEQLIKSHPRIKLSSSQTLKLDGVETGLLS